MAVPVRVSVPSLLISRTSSAAKANGTGATRKRGTISSRSAGFTPTQNVSGSATGGFADAVTTK